MRLRAYVTGCFAALSLGACGQTPERRPPEKSPLVRLTRIEAGFEATLMFQKKSGLLNFGIVPQEGKRAAGLPMLKRVDLWRPLVEQLFKEHGRAKEYLVAVGQYPELSSRLAFAAACSGKWNTQTGQPRTGGANPAVKQLIADRRLNSEIEAFFDS